MHLAGVVVAHVDAIDPSLAFQDIALENLPDGGVVDLVPGNLVGLEEAVGEGLGAILAGFFRGDGAEDDVDLAVGCK